MKRPASSSFAVTTGGEVLLASVIIPAHNEEAVIGRLLDDLGGLPSTVEVIVVCNGCTDDTARVARDRGAAIGVRVLELPAASKPAALNAGDSAASGPIRLYIDADVRVSTASVLRVVDALREPTVLAARPPIRYDTAGAGAGVRAFYRARTRTKPLMSALWGAGFYGLSAEGRRRWEAFPGHTPDDFFASSLFGADEWCVVDAEPVVVSTPHTVRALLHTLRRVYDLPGSQVRSSASTLMAVLRRGTVWPTGPVDAVIYCSIAVAARLAMAGPNSRWPRDETTRQTE